ncbi:hypothetical protein [Methanotorris igneus]|uniref:Uncharacterized protein n=1 Tax=Methanotorris igneus (strain DSM 5666 / JCM 11834 / Kol 5) TaxID=880724 RepID=F6BBP8_METIK|nr:hypothetical protein [Methanotorris igneus]AEF96057.1 hypothetical protein Metig_0501 [Methanotorris igneus Kol 5]
MERNITIGLIIALVLTCIGAFWMSSHSSEGGGFLIDFLQNLTADNSTTNDTYLNDTYTNSTINETINNTDNSTVNETVTDDNSTTLTLSFSTAAVFDNSTNSSIISVDASKENITVGIVLFTSYDNANFTEAASLANVTLPTTITVPVNTSYSEMYYYLEILYNNVTYVIPENTTEVVNISIT